MASSQRTSKDKHKSSKNRGDPSNRRKNTAKQTDEKKNNIVRTLGLVLIAVCVGVAHRSHVYTLFENDKHFSHLSTLERELAFRTEMGLYFSYFKTIITAPSFGNGLHQVMRDNVTEYPSTINTLKRFNLYPEVTLGFTYRLYQSINDHLGRPTKMCWKVNRGEGLSPVQSCEGLGEPSYFYVEFIFLLNGFMMALFFLLGAYLSDSILGGLLCVICFFFNHGECTRVMWTPPLRESFGYPMFVLQMFLVTKAIKTKSETWASSLLIAAAQICFMLSWQFAQFTLLTQTLAVLATYFLQFISTATLKTVLCGQTIGLLASYLLLFGNEMLLTSFFACCLVSAWVIVVLEPLFEKLKFRLLIWIFQGPTLIAVTLGAKTVLSKILHLEDDAHIGEIFRSKFTDFQNFHTMLYTCAKEFDFIETETLWKLLMTLLIPSATVAFLGAAVFLLQREWTSQSQVQEQSSVKSNDVSKRKQNKENAEIVYHIFQLLAFTAMAMLVMRLKLFWTPQLCLFSSLLASRKIFNFSAYNLHVSALVILFAVMSLQGASNIQKQRSIMGEFSNIEQEELVEWINAKTSKDAVFAGPMPTMATIKLCTLRPIVNHPHYEDAGLRNRTKLVYSLYSRKPVVDVVKNLEALKVQYAVLEDSWCVRRTKVGCSMPEIWDIEDKVNRGKMPVCTLLKSKPEPHFKRVFQNNVYQVLKLNVAKK